MREEYQPYFKIFIGDYYLDHGHPILLVTSYGDIGSFSSEYFAFFDHGREKKYMTYQ